MTNNGAGYITVGVFSFILGATVMFIINVNYFNSKFIGKKQSDYQLCGPPAPSNCMGLVDYRDIVSSRGDSMIIVHGPISISFIDPNTVPPGIDCQDSTGGRLYPNRPAPKL